MVELLGTQIVPNTSLDAYLRQKLLTNAVTGAVQVTHGICVYLVYNNSFLMYIRVAPSFITWSYKEDNPKDNIRSGCKNACMGLPIYHCALPNFGKCQSWFSTANVKLSNGQIPKTLATTTPMDRLNVPLILVLILNSSYNQLQWMSGTQLLLLMSTFFSYHH